MGKLIEEHAELIQHPSLEEVVDMIEVLVAVSSSLGYSEKQTFDYLQDKRLERGGFETGTVLVSVSVR